MISSKSQWTCSVTCGRFISLDLICIPIVLLSNIPSRNRVSNFGKDIFPLPTSYPKFETLFPRRQQLNDTEKIYSEKDIFPLPTSYPKFETLFPRRQQLNDTEYKTSDDEFC